MSVRFYANEGGKMSDAIAPDVIKIFYCYARKDKRLRDELERHMATLDRLKQVMSWYDREILPGTEWKSEIHRHLDASDIVLLLISHSFIQSDYCYGVEMHRALERHKAGASSVLPIILRPCNWKELPIGVFQALPENGKPITRWQNRDEAFQNVVAGIQEVVKRLITQRSEPMNTHYSFQNHQRLQVLIEVNGDIVDTYHLDKESLLVGRSEDADILVRHPLISRFIARIFWQNGAWKIMDVSARNGLYYHEQHVAPGSPIVLVPGDIFWLATDNIRLHIREEQQH